MGGDQLVPFLVGDKAEAGRGEQIRQAWAEEYNPLIEFARPFEGAHRLLAEAASAGIVVVLGSGAGQGVGGPCGGRGGFGLGL